MLGKKRVKAKESSYGRRDVARDDDFLSDTLLADLVPNCKLLVHHAWGHGRHTYDAPVLLEILSIVRQYVVNQVGTSPPKDRVREAMRHFVELEIVKRHLRGKDNRERAPFLMHANRYFQIYLPTSHFEFVPTERYTAHTEKNELAVRSTAPFETGKIISGLCGVLVALTNEENEELRGGQDFSIVVNVHTKRFFILLGPARFVNHDCNPNVKMKRDGKSLTFEVIRPIKTGDEILSSYGENYFGEENCECLCETCEKAGAGMFAAKEDASDVEGERRSSTAVPARASSEATPEMPEFEERKTRRGTVFWRAPPMEDDEEDEDEEDDEEAVEAEHEDEDDVDMNEAPLAPEPVSAPAVVAATAPPPDAPEDPDAEGEHRPSSSREVSASLIDASSIASSIERPLSAPEFALVPPDDTGSVTTVPLLTPEATPTHETAQPRLSPDDVLDTSTPLLSVVTLESGILSPASLALSDDKPVPAESAATLLTPPPTSSEGTPPSETLGPDSVGELAIGFAVLDDDDMECPYSPLSSALSSALSEVPSDFDIEEAMNDIMGNLSRPSSPVATIEEVYIRPETPPGDNCAALRCGVLFTEKVQPVGKWCSRCARHFKIFQVQWPHRTGERRQSPRIPGPSIWSRGRQVLDSSPPASREASVSSQRQKRKAKEPSVEPTKTKRSRLSNVVTAKKVKRTYTRRVVHQDTSGSDPESEEAEQESGEGSQDEDAELQSEEQDEQDEDEDEQDEQDEVQTEDSSGESDVERIPVIQPRTPDVPAPPRRGRPPKAASSVAKSTSAPAKSFRGRPLQPSPKAAQSSARKVTAASTSRARRSSKSSTPAQERKAALHDPSPSPSPSRSPSPSVSPHPPLPRRQKGSAVPRSSEKKVISRSARKDTSKRELDQTHKKGDEDLAARRSQGRRTRDMQSDFESEQDSDAEERPSKKTRRCDDATPDDARAVSPPSLAMYRPLLNGLHISPRGGRSYFSASTKPGPPKKVEGLRMQVPQPPIWWKSTSANRITSDLIAPPPAQRPRWAPPPPPRELPPAPSPVLSSPLSPTRSVFGTPSISPPNLAGGLLGAPRSIWTSPPPKASIGITGLNTSGLKSARYGLDIQGHSRASTAVSGTVLSRSSGSRRAPSGSSKWNVDGKDVIVLDSSDEDNVVTAPEKPKTNTRTITPLTAQSRGSSSSSPGGSSKSASSKPPRMSGDARLIYEAKLAEGVKTRNGKRLSEGKRTTKAALGRHRND